MRTRVRTTLKCTLFAWQLIGCADAGSASDAHDSLHERHSGAGHGGAHEGGADADDDFQGCPDAVPSVAPGLLAKGEHFALKVIAAMPSELERYINGWTVELRALDGTQVPDAEIVRGQTFMPVHGHDGGVQPQIKALSEPGQFQVDRLNFSMRGQWEVRFWLRSEASEDDNIVFDVCVAK